VPQCRCNRHPINLVLMAKLLAIGLIAKQYVFPPKRNLPFFEFMNYLGPTDHLHVALIILICCGIGLVIFNYYIGLGFLAIATGLLLAELGCKPCYADSRFFILSIFLLLSLHEKSSGPWLLRIQVIFVYFGAGLNKLLDPDWTNGQYFEAWMHTKIHNTFYISLAAILPAIWLSKMMGWFTIITELSMAIGFSLKKLNIFAIWCGLLLHGTALILVEDFGIFFSAVLFSYLAFVQWPKHIIVSIPSSRGFHELRWILKNTDFDHLYKWKLLPAMNKIEIWIEGVRHQNYQAIQKLILFTPFWYFVAALIILFPYNLDLKWVQGTAIVSMIFLLSPVSAKVLSFLRKRRNKVRVLKRLFS